MKICSVLKQKYVDGAPKGKNFLVAYFPRTRDEVIAMIMRDNKTSVSNVTEVTKDKVYTADMTKENGEKWKLTFIYHDILELEVWNETLKKVKGAIQKEAELVVNAPIEFDEINWVDKLYF